MDTVAPASRVERAYHPQGLPTASRVSAKLGAREQMRLALLAAGRLPRRALARIRGSHLLRWRDRTRPAGELVLAPPDLRAHDPSFFDEIRSGSFGLAGRVAALAGRSPFALIAPGGEWTRELHGFGWLRHLAADRTPAVEAAARRLLEEWFADGHRQAVAWEIAVLARRVLAWLAHADLLLDDADRRMRARVLRSLNNQVGYLAACWCDAPDGHPRLLAALALVEADLCIAPRFDRVGRSMKRLAGELERQILSDGGHASRNPAVLVELMLDLLPLRQCSIARGCEPHPELASAITRIAAMLKRLRLGDGLLARFHGGGRIDPEALAIVLAYDNGAAIAAEGIGPSGFIRLQRGTTIVLVDAGPPPPLELAANACASCLAFELSVGHELLFCNAGMPKGHDPKARAIARATASHNTLVINDSSSSKLIRNARLERRIGAAPICYPDQVGCDVREEEGAVTLAATHNGYLQRMGLIHARTLRLDANGDVLTGVDSLRAPKGDVRFAWDVPFAVHFHLHPEATAHAGPSAQLVDIRLKSGAAWRFGAESGAVSVEASTYFAESTGARQRQQIIVRALCCGTAELAWTIERLE
jgi:uncharacterized heparinase superfamily protein